MNYERGLVSRLVLVFNSLLTHLIMYWSLFKSHTMHDAYDDRYHMLTRLKLNF